MVLVFLTKTLALLQLPKREGGDNDMEKKRQRDIERERHAQRRRHKLSPTVYNYQQDLPGKR